MKTAVILNFTGNNYHFGCYGTSYEIYHRLLEKGYYVNSVSIQVTQQLDFFPESTEQFYDNDYAKEFLNKNIPLVSAIDEADLVVVNGEGTLHQLSRSAMTLLYQVFFASHYMQKPTQLINHSCFPQGDCTRGDLDELYQNALSSVQTIVPRESLSARNYQELGINATQGFDSLPLFIGRNDMLGLRYQGVEDKVLLCGGMKYTEAEIVKVSNLIKKKNGMPVNFLVGSKLNPAVEDINIYEAFKSQGLAMNLIEAESFEQWCQEIASSALTISGRFHYSIAALSMGVPCISFPSNTPKTQAVYEMLGAEGFFNWSDESSLKALEEHVANDDYERFALDEDTREKIINLAEMNYANF